MSNLHMAFLQMHKVGQESSMETVHASFMLLDQSNYITDNIIDSHLSSIESLSSPAVYSLICSIINKSMWII